MIRRIVSALAIGASLALVALPAAAADSEVEYSTDGVVWSASPPPAVFPASWQPVPGSTTTATLYVRAARPGTTVVGVYAGAPASSDPQLLAATTLAGATGPATALDGLGACTAVADQAVLAEGEVLAVPITIAFSPALTDGRGASLALDLLVDLSDTGVPVLPGGCPVDPEIIAAFPAASAERLTTTGQTLPWELLLAAAAVLIGGLAGVLAARSGSSRGRTR